MARQSGLHLTRSEVNTAEIAALTESITDAGGARIGIDGLVPELGRRARRSLLHPRLIGRKVHTALTWEAPDRRDDSWYPQGISNSVRTGVAGNLLVVAWYSKRDHGSRVSFIDLDRRRYEHVLLVEPTVADGHGTIKPLAVHAGGLVWHNRFLHVAATRRGFLTCHLDDLLRVSDSSSVDTHGHRYVLPVRFGHRADASEETEKLRYSFMTLDRSEDTPALVVGEYGSAQKTRRLVRIPVDDDTGMLHTDDNGVARPELLEDDGLLRMQGVAVADGAWYVTASEGHWTPGTVHVGEPGDFRAHRWATPMGPEDVVHWPSTDLLWCASEHPHRRWIFAMRRADLHGG